MGSLNRSIRNQNNQTVISLTSGGKRVGAGRPKALTQVTVKINPKVYEKDTEAEFAKIEPIVLDKINRISSKEPSELSENEMRMLPVYLKTLEYFKVKADKRPPKRDQSEAPPLNFSGLSTEDDTGVDA
jgi:hypothetical protein